MSDAILPNEQIMNDLRADKMSVRDACDQLFVYWLQLYGIKPNKRELQVRVPKQVDAPTWYIGLDGKRKTPLFKFAVPPTAQPHYPALKINFEIMQIQATKKLRDQQPAPADDPTLAAIAAYTGMTLPDMAESIWQVADKIDEDGNRGMARTYLERPDLALNLKWLAEAYPEAWTGIVFFNQERDVYQCRKNPHWKVVWCQRYGALGFEERCAKVATKQAQIALAGEKAKVEEAKLPPRPARHVLGEWDELTTRQVAGHYVYARMMCTRESNFRMAALQAARGEGIKQLGRFDFLNHYAEEVWREQVDILHDELRYRDAAGDAEARDYIRVDKDWIRCFIDEATLQAVVRGDQLPPPHFAIKDEGEET